jgi:hypothetical protein
LKPILSLNALTSYQTLLGALPPPSSLTLALATTYLALSRPSDALSTLHTLHTTLHPTDPDYFEYQLLLAKAEQALGRHHESSLVLDRVRLRTTTGHHLLLGYDWVRVQVENRVKMGEVPEAIRLVEEAVSGEGDIGQVTKA